MLFLAVSLLLLTCLCASNEGRFARSSVTCLRMYNRDITTTTTTTTHNVVVVVTFVIHVDIIKCRYSRCIACSKTARVDHYEIGRRRARSRDALLFAKRGAFTILSRKITATVRSSCRRRKGLSYSAALSRKVSAFQVEWGRENLQAMV